MMRKIICICYCIVVSACTLQTYDKSYDKSLGTAEIEQDLLTAGKIMNVDGHEGGLGRVTKVSVTPGPHMVGFFLNPGPDGFKPTDPNEKHNFFTDQMLYWVTFTAEAGHVYTVTWVPIPPANVLTELSIVDKSTKKAVSKSVGNYWHLPKL